MLTTDQAVLQNYTSSKLLWLGIPGIERTNKGRTFLTFYTGGTGEEIGNVVVLLKSDDEIHYGEPIAVCLEDGYRCFDPCLWIDPLGRLWLTWSRCPDDGLYGAICDNPDADQIVFGPEFLIGHNVMMNKPTVLSTGEWAFPIAVWKEGVRAISEEYDSTITPKGSFLYLTSDNGKTFHIQGYADVKERSFDEHRILELKNGVLRMFVRTNYGIGAADSYDGGSHWGEGFDTGYGGPCSRFFIGRMPSGRILLINHDAYTGRNNLTAMLSEDEGQTFPYKLRLDSRANVSYPDVSMDSTGRIHIVYDRERGGYERRFEDIMKNAREILTASIREEDILRGKLESPDGYLMRVAYKLTKYDGPDQNPFHEPDRLSSCEYAQYLNAIRDSTDVVTEIFNEYRINCSNIQNARAKNLDRLIESYLSDKELNTLNSIIELVRDVGDDSVYSEKTIVDQICAYVSDHLEQDPDTEQIADHFHFSSHYIRLIFKRQTGTNITEFKTASKIKKAKLLLKGCEDKISNISARCGFDNPSYFTEVFTKHVGICPTDYRRLHSKHIPVTP